MSEKIEEKIIDYLNEKSGKRFRYGVGNLKFIRGRLKEGYEFSDFVHVIDVKVDEWKNTDMDKYLRPETLFQPAKFDSYLNQPKKNDNKMFSMEDVPF